MANTFFYASVIWGVIAPNLMFGPASMFNAINYFLVDFILPIPSDYLKKVYLNTWMYQARIPVMLAAISMVPPAKSYHYTNWLAVGLVFQYFVRKYHNAWHLRFTYVMSAAFESGAAFMGLLSFFVFTIRDVGFPIWWGNPEVDSCRLDNYPHWRGGHVCLPQGLPSSPTSLVLDTLDIHKAKRVALRENGEHVAPKLVFLSRTE